MASTVNHLTSISISPLLRKISVRPQDVEPAEITTAIDHIFTNQLSSVQAAVLLTALHFTKLDEKPDIIAAAAEGLRGNGLQIKNLPSPREKCVRGSYMGGLVDIVGTGGDGHNTFNVSTASAILATSCGVLVCKHGNRASTSTSGSADVLTSLGANLMNVTPEKVISIFEANDGDLKGNEAGKFCFLFAPVYHPSIRHVAGLRKELGFKTIFNLLGPLANPVDYSLSTGLEARIIGVGKQYLGRIFAETLSHLGVKKAMVVCGSEELDEISISTTTNCWWLRETKDGKVEIREFKIEPTKTFGVSSHPLSRVASGKGPDENAVILKRILRGEVDENNDTDERAIFDFVLVNTAALLVVSGLFDGDGKEEEEELDVDGVLIGDKWKKAVEVVRDGARSGRAWIAWQEFLRKTV